MSRVDYPHSVPLTAPFCTPAATGDWGYDLEQPAHDILNQMDLKEGDYWWDCSEMRFRNGDDASRFAALVEEVTHAPTIRRPGI